MRCRLSTMCKGATRSAVFHVFFPYPDVRGAGEEEEACCFGAIAEGLRDRSGRPEEGWRQGGGFASVSSAVWRTADVRSLDRARSSFGATGSLA